MRILIDIGHPGHVHLFKNFALGMKAKGHEILFTCREKEFEIELLKVSNFKFVSFGKKFKSIKGKLFGLILFNYKMLRTALKFKPDLFLSAGSMYAAQVSFLLRKPHVSMEDTGNSEQVRLYLPFTDVVLTSTAFHKSYGRKQIRYPGSHELAYLHKKYFSPDLEVINKLGLRKDEKYVVIRFISWNATHDLNVKGLTISDKIRIVKELSKHCKVFISSESELPNELKEYQISIRPEEMHSVLNYSSLLFGESGTMTSECFVLGVPAIQISGLPEGTMGVLTEQHNSGLVFIFQSYSSDILDKAIQLISEEGIKKEWQIKRDEVLSDKIDLTSFLIWFIENYPESFKNLKKNSSFINNFRLLED